MRGATIVSVGALALCIGAAPAAAQRWTVGVGLGVADTEQNAIALVGTVTREFAPAPWLFGSIIGLTGYVDSELGVPDFREGAEYLEPEREVIVNPEGERLRPQGDELWQEIGWSGHLALYVTVTPLSFLKKCVPSVRAWDDFQVGVGYAHNGLDGSGQGSVLLSFDIAERTEIDIEYLDLKTGVPDFFGGRWRARMSLGFWTF